MARMTAIQALATNFQIEWTQRVGKTIMHFIYDQTI